MTPTYNPWSVTASLQSFSPMTGISYLLKTFFFLGIFALIMYVVLKYVFPKLGYQQFAGQHIEVLDKKMLEMNVSAYLLKVGSHYWLVGTSQKNISLIGEVDPQNLDFKSPLPKKPELSFAEIFAKIKGKKS